MAECLHCGLGIPSDHVDSRFCCPGCEAAHGLISGLGLSRYYKSRQIDPEVRPLRPDEDGLVIDYSAQVKREEDGIGTLYLMIEGMHCAACVWLIENVLSRQDGVVKARVNMSTRRLVLKWDETKADPNALVASVNGLGYRLVPYDPDQLGVEAKKQEKELLYAMAVAGFAAGNVMLLSVSVWAGHFQDMGVSTRDLLHWISALVVLPAVAYAGVPFFRSAVIALKAGRTNMDVPISLAVILAAGMSLFETMRSGEHAYFDSAITLLFFLLIGRYLDRRARGRARSAAEHMLALGGAAVTVINADGTHKMIPPRDVREGMKIFVAAGDRIAVDGTVLSGESDVDTSLISGETVPVTVRKNDRVFAGTNNLSGSLTVEITAAGEGTLLAEIVRLMEDAEQGRAKYVAIADRVARYYAPIVHLLALATFIGWVSFTDVQWQAALLTAIAVLIITCPCALALAVPAVQVIGSGRLLRQGILVKSGTALERLAEADMVVFDKTGTLTEGKPELLADAVDVETLSFAAAMASASRHPLSKALSAAMPHVAPADGVKEFPGKGLQLGQARLGSRLWCGVEGDESGQGPELWLSRPGFSPVRFRFRDRPRADAAETIDRLKRNGYRISLLSGDRPSVVESVAAELGIEEWYAGCSPSEKCAHLERWAEEGRKVAMVGDGLNDAPALTAAHVSLSPSSAVEVSQNAADVVFQGDRLAPAAEALEVSRKANVLVKQNFALALLYNGVTIPLAVAGLITPLFAAIAMSSSSLVVIGNALRLARRKSL